MQYRGLQPGRQAGKSVIFSVTGNKFRESILRHKIELEDRAAAPTVTVTRSIVIFPKPTAGGGVARANRR